MLSKGWEAEMHGIVLGNFRKSHNMKRGESGGEVANVVTVISSNENNRPLAASSAFLILTFRELAFPPGPNIGTHIEGSLINFTAICLSVVHCNVGKTLASVASRRRGPDSASARTIPITFLFLCATAAGVIKSAYPRLAQACRMAAITAVFSLTDGIGETSVPASSWTTFVIISSLAASSSLLSTLIFLRGSSRSYTHRLLRAMESTRSTLSERVERAFRPQGSTNLSDRSYGNALDLGSRLRRSYAHAFLEPRYGRLHVKELQAFPNIVDRIRTELSWGETISLTMRLSTSEKSQIHESFDGPSTVTTEKIYASFILVERTIKDAFDIKQSKDNSSLSIPTPEDYAIQMRELADAARLLKLNLGTAQASVESPKSGSGPPVAALYAPEPFSKGLFSVSLLAVSIIKIAEDTDLILRIGRGISIKLQEHKRRRLWLPKLTRRWFNESLSAEWSDAGAKVDSIARAVSSIPPSPRSDEMEVEGEYQGFALPRNRTLGSEQEYWSLFSRLARMPVYVLHRWSSLSGSRVRLSRAIRGVKHSSNLRYALKNGIGVLLLSLPAFLPSSNQASHLFRKYHLQWMVATYIFVLETNTGATIQVGGLRLLGTLLGAVMACLIWLIAHRTPYTFVLLYTLAEVPISWLILRTSVAPIGVVASITIPPIIFTTRNKATHGSILPISVNRAMAIALGIIVAVLVNHFVFPRHCRRMFESQTAKTLRKFTQLYILLTKYAVLFCRTMGLLGLVLPHRLTLSMDPGSASQSRLWVELETDIHDSLFRANSLIDMMWMEISLLPKPLRTYRKIIFILHRILDLFIGLRRIRENIPKKETVTDVFSYRKDLVSCICVSLYASEMAFETSESLPQFLPSPQHALDALIREKHLAMQMYQLTGVGAWATSPGGSDGTASISRDAPRHGSARNRPRRTLAASYALAENALMEDVVKHLEELLQIMRHLHGTTTWAPELSVGPLSPPPLSGWQSPPSRSLGGEGAALTMGLVDMAPAAEGDQPAVETDGNLSPEGTIRGPLCTPVITPVMTPERNRDRWI
ncbi:Fusaric acid resistance protein family-domain-containing protein [Cantharellus anzutake]|uniref:Fusaric acid resistance protein family-domain-containing protein n=1 Tax=Cantharellus anzutake TaxID=1750568 RepID=UPI0019080720|nr:Fusaric acid resistance protein family-domain-containing protein [Cantharellus anzutake]KAF8328929.1 Fusaric acid resistance protein family-domain-containing protein [Cantharellus anzutake]